MNLKCLWILTIIFILFVPHYSLADDSSWEGDGYTVMPLSNNQIQLVSEKIQIVEQPAWKPPFSQSFSKNMWLIDSELIFKNLGGSTSVQMGFPIESSEEGDFPQDLKTWVDGVPVTTTIKKGIPNPALAKLKPQIGPFGEVYAYNVKFKKGQEIKIKHVYTVGGYADDYDWNVNYILRTGALWKGVIKDIRIVIVASTKDPFFVRPGGYEAKLKNNDPFFVKPKGYKSKLINNELIISWHFKNIKPITDIIISNLNYNGLRQLETKDLYKAYHEKFGTIDDVAINMLDEGSIIYLRNLIFAKYGYPFKNALIRSWFYYKGSLCKEDPHFSMNKIPKKLILLTVYLKKLENAIEECKHLATSKEITKKDVVFIANKYNVPFAQIGASCCNPLLYGRSCEGNYWTMWR